MPAQTERLTSAFQGIGADTKEIFERFGLTDSAFLLGSRFQHLDEGFETGSTTGRTARVSHVSSGAVTRVRFMFANWAMVGQVETDGANSIYVRAGVEYNGVTVPLTFKGQTELTLLPGDMIWSDWAYIFIPRGATFYTRTFNRVASASHTVPKGIVPFSPEWRVDGDYSAVATTPSGTSAGMYTYAPIACQGWGRAQPSVAIFGDSIPSGAADGAGHDYGYVTRALAGRVGAINLSKGGASSYDLPVSGKRMTLARLATHAFFAFGQNDMANVTTYSTVSANFQARFDALNAAGLKVMVALIPPRAGQTTAGNDWSVSNQTKPNSNFDAGGTWEQMNTWLRGYPEPVFAVLDLNEVWASSYGAYTWNPARVQDGIHPNTAGHDAARDILIWFLKRGGLYTPKAPEVGFDVTATGFYYALLNTAGYLHTPRVIGGAAPTVAYAYSANGTTWTTVPAFPFAFPANTILRLNVTAFTTLAAITFERD